MRKISLVLALGLGVVAAPAMAGPIGSGLWLTESLARGSAPARAEVHIAANDTACLIGARAEVAQHAAVRTAKMKGDKLAVQFHRGTDPAAETASVHAIVAKTCAGAQLASAS